MKKGSAMEGFIREDGTIRPIEHYDDTELRGKIQTNTDNISNLDSRVTELEEHGGVEDPTKADKVENATAGNLASLDEEGNLQDSGKKPADFAPVVHTHDSLSGNEIIIEASQEGEQSVLLNLSALDSGDPYITLSLNDETAPSRSKSFGIDLSNIDNFIRVKKNPVKSTDATPTYDDFSLITSGAVKAAINEVNEKIDNMHALEYEDETYLSRMGVGQLNRDDDELDGASIYGKDAIRIAVNGGTVYIDADNIDNLKCLLLGLEIPFVRDENGDYAINSTLKEYLNNLLEEMPADKCVPCVVHAQWWNGSSYDGGHFPGALCRHTYTTPGLPRTIFLSFLGNLFYATRTANNDFPNVWTKFENPFATVLTDDDSGDNSGNNSADDDEPSDNGLDG